MKIPQEIFSIHHQCHTSYSFQESLPASPTPFLRLKIILL